MNFYLNLNIRVMVRQQLTGILIGVLVLISGNLQAGGITDYSKSPTIAYVIEDHNYSLTLSSLNVQNSTKVKYRPNTRAASGIQFSYMGLTVAYFTKSPINEKEQYLYGNTSYEDIRGGLFFGNNDQWALLGYYNRFKGLYIENSVEIDPSLSANGPRIQRDDFSIFNSGLTLLHVFSPQSFSATAAYLQTARQGSSGGSWLMSAAFDGSTFSAKSPLLPVQVRAQYGDEALLQKGDFATISASGGYGYSLIWNNFFLTGTILIGYGFQTRRVTMGTEESTTTAQTYKTSLGASLGYNGDSFFSGATLVSDTNRFQTKDIEFSPTLDSIRLFLGGRF